MAKKSVKSEHSKEPANKHKRAEESVSKARQTIGFYLIQRLQDYGVGTVFGIPGDFVLQFYAMLQDSPLELIWMTREDCAGYAADGCARLNRIGAVCVTYCVGGLSLCYSIAGAYAEKSPVIVISGAPGVEERRRDPLLHHRVHDFNTQFEVFEKITVDSARLEDPLTAFRDIDRCLDSAIRFKHPVYLELPRDRIQAELLLPHKVQTYTHESDPDALRESLEEAVEMISKASNQSLWQELKFTALIARVAVGNRSKERHPNSHNAAGQVGDQREASTLSGRP